MLFFVLFVFLFIFYCIVFLFEVLMCVMLLMLMNFSRSSSFRCVVALKGLGLVLKMLFNFVIFVLFLIVLCFVLVFGSFNCNGLFFVCVVGLFLLFFVLFGSFKDDLNVDLCL